MTHFDSYVGLGDANYKIQRGITMLGCLPTELSLGALDSKDGKALMEMTMTYQPEDIKWEGPADVVKSNLSGKAKSWLKAHFEPIGLFGGIPAASVTKIDLPKYTAKISEAHTGMFRQPERNASAWEVAGHKFDIMPSGFEAAKNFIQKILYDGQIAEGDFVDWSVNIKAPDNKTIIGEIVFIQSAPQKFTWSPELKGGQDGLAISTIDCLTEECKVEIKHKAG